MPRMSPSGPIAIQDSTTRSGLIARRCSRMAAIVQGMIKDVLDAFRDRDVERRDGGVAA